MRSDLKGLSFLVKQFVKWQIVRLFARFKYICRFPAEKISAEFTVLNPSGRVFSDALLTGAALFISCAVVFLFFLL